MNQAGCSYLKVLELKCHVFGVRWPSLGPGWRELAEGASAHTQLPKTSFHVEGDGQPDMAP